MLGCIAYLLVFRKHPFLGKGKLAILTCNPEYPTEGELADFVKSMLRVNHRDRPSASAIIDIIDEKIRNRQ